MDKTNSKNKQNKKQDNAQATQQVNAVSNMTYSVQDNYQSAKKQSNKKNEHGGR